MLLYLLLLYQFFKIKGVFMYSKVDDNIEYTIRVVNIKYARNYNMTYVSFCLT